MAIQRKATFQPYDMDTALGTNNSGVLMFGYGLEDTDTVSSIISGGDSGGREAPVFNAQDSVLWNNLRDAFRSEITQMYKQLRTSRAWTYTDIEQRAEDHQAKWPEAVYNEDAYEKQLVPLIDPVTVDETTGQLIRTDRYLTMIQGSKKEQRKWWLWNRFRYMDSKYVTGDAVNNIISMRVFNSGTLTITPAIDLYVGVSFGGGTTVALKRSTANTPQTFEYRAETGVTEMETWIYSADLINGLGDLSGLYANEFDFSKASRLKTLKIGDSTAGYSNTNLTTLDLRNMALLESLDLRNCPNLAIAVNLEGSPRLTEAYFDGTSITGADFAEGGSLETLHLPGTITALTLINLYQLDEFVCSSLANVSRLMLSNMPADVVDPVQILNAIQPNSQVNIQGLYLELTNAAAIDAFLDLLDTMQGVSRERGPNGEWLYHDYDTAQVSGEIHTTSLTGAEIAEYNARYPYIRVTADHTTSVLTYKTYDGATTITTETILDGGDGAYTGTPGRTSDAQYNYTFAGWATSPNGDASADATKGVVADRTVYAAYTKTVRTYTVYFYNGSTLLETDRNVPYGGSTTYNGTTPVSPDGSAEDYPFEGWKPAPTNIQGDTSCYAQFGSPVEVVEITDSWDTIIANIDNGTYATKYKVGNYKPLDLGTEGTINMQIVAMDADELASGGYAPLSFVGMELLNTSQKQYDTKEIIDWNECLVRTNYFKNTIKPLIPSNVRGRLQRVNKSYFSKNSTTEISVDDLWIPSLTELFSHASAKRYYSGYTVIRDSYESEGVTYQSIYSSYNAKKHKANTPTGVNWYWLRTTPKGFGDRLFSVNSSGGVVTYEDSVDVQNGVCLGFCLGLEQGEET